MAKVESSPEPIHPHSINTEADKAAKSKGIGAPSVTSPAPETSMKKRIKTFFASFTSKSKDTPPSNALDATRVGEAPQGPPTQKAQSLGSWTILKQKVSDKVASWNKTDSSRNEPENIQNKLNAKIKENMQGGRLTKSMTKEEATKAAVNSLDKAQLAILKKPENLSKILEENNPTLFNAIKLKLSPTERQEFSGRLVADTINALVKDFGDQKKSGIDDSTAAKMVVNSLSKNHIDAFSSDQHLTTKLVKAYSAAPELFDTLMDKLPGGRDKLYNAIIDSRINILKEHPAKLDSLELSTSDKRAFENYSNTATKLVKLHENNPRNGNDSAISSALRKQLPEGMQQEMAAQIVDYTINHIISQVTANLGRRSESPVLDAVASLGRPKIEAFIAAISVDPNAAEKITTFLKEQHEIFMVFRNELTPEQQALLDNKGAEFVPKRRLKSAEQSVAAEESQPSNAAQSVKTAKMTATETPESRFKNFIQTEPESIPAAFKILSKLLETAPSNSKLTPHEKSRLAEIKKEIDEKIATNTNLNDVIREINLQNVLSDADKLTVQQLTKQKAILEPNLLLEAGTLIKKGFDNNKGVFGTPQDLRDDFARFNQYYLGNAFE